MDGWIKIYRKSMENPIFQKPNYWAVWSYLLLNANYRDNAFISRGQKHLIKRGQLLTSKRKIADHFGLSSSTVQLILKYLEVEHMIEQKPTAKYTVIEVKNYESYQEAEHPIENKSTFNRKQIETNKNVKNERKRESVCASMEYLLTIPVEDISVLAKGLQVSEGEVRSKGEDMYNYCKSHGKRYKDYRLLLRNALKKDFKAVDDGYKQV